MTAYENAVNYVISFYDQAFTNNITLNIDYAYGETYSGDQNGNVQLKLLPNATANGSFELGTSETSYNSFNYTTVVAQLKNDEQTTNQVNAYATLPQTSPYSGTLWIANAQQKALGLAGGGGTLAGFDGVIGTISDTELAAGGYSADWTTVAPASGKQYYMLGSIEHETSEFMGRISWDGTDAINNAPSYTIMDLFRYSGVGVRDTTPDTNNNTDAYFSIDNGNTLLGYWNNVYSGGTPDGDLGDWATGKPSTAPANFPANPIGNDAYLNNSGSGVVNGVSSTDFTLMNVLGWDLGNTTPPPTVTPAPNDFNSDGDSDILWQNTNGQAAVWLMNGTTAFSQPAVGGNPGSSWQVVGSGHFSGGDQADILWQNTNGQAAIWLMNGTTPFSEPVVGANPGPSWRTVGSGDFNGDGDSDILWQNTSGQAAIWLMNGTTPISQPAVGANPGPSWRIAGIGDFNGDGKSDILWQNSNGQAAIWLMNGTTPFSQPLVGENPGPSWRISGVGDFNGDGDADILWQNTNGQASIWLMNGTTPFREQLVGGNPGPSWHSVGTGDYNGDGKSDILWQNDSGQASIWLMNGTTPVSEVLVGSNPGPSWHIHAAS
jgi:hypothetical protein